MYVESAKVLRTSHWYLDFLPLKEVDRLYARSRPPEKGSDQSQHPAFVISRRMWGVLCMAAGLGMVALAVLVGRHFSGVSAI